MAGRYGTGTTVATLLEKKAGSTLADKPKPWAELLIRGEEIQAKDQCIQPSVFRLFDGGALFPSRTAFRPSDCRHANATIASGRRQAHLIGQAKDASVSMSDLITRSNAHPSATVARTLGSAEI